jgi:transcriptional antiterminator RfaH
MVPEVERQAHDALFSGSCTIEDAASREWMVLHTRSRQEKAVARHLEASRVLHFLPLRQQITRSAGRRFRSWVPLFPGYVFLFGEREDAFAAIETKRVCQVLQVIDQARFEREISQIAAATKAGAELAHHSPLAVGQRCRVAAGPFMGIEGVVIENQRLTRLVLQVDMLGQGAALEIEPHCLERLN